MKMSEYDILEPTLKEILKAINPSRKDRLIRNKIINELRNVVESVESFRGAILKPFGSFVSNLFTRWGDLDISVELPNGSNISSAQKERKLTLLKDLQRALIERGGFCSYPYILDAKVPILIFKSTPQNISCDISIDNVAGLMKSRFLFWISAIDGRLRDMVLLVKEWAEAHKINNPKEGSLNSYSLSLLVIFHFQTCVPAILPPLKDIYPRNLIDDLKGVRANAERNIAEECAANIARFKSENRSINRSSLSELFVSFIAKFSDLHLKASERGIGICTFTGKWERIASITSGLPNNLAIFIKDPFEQSENSARAVKRNSKESKMISEAFKTTHHSLTADNQNKYALLVTLTRPQTSEQIKDPFEQSENSARAVSVRHQTSEAFNTTHHSLTADNQNKSALLATLTRPQTSEFIARTPVSYYSNYIDHQQRRQPQVHLATVHSPSPSRVQHHKSPVIGQSQGMLYKSQNGHQNESEIQEMWGPKYDRTGSASSAAGPSTEKVSTDKYQKYAAIAGVVAGIGALGLGWYLKSKDDNDSDDDSDK